MKNWFGAQVEKAFAKIEQAERFMNAFGWNGIVPDAECY